MYPANFLWNRFQLKLSNIMKHGFCFIQRMMMSVSVLVQIQAKLFIGADRDS
jgi:hypothetical protein